MNAPLEPSYRRSTGRVVATDLLTVEARVVAASIDTYLECSEAVGQVPTVSRPGLESAPRETLQAETAALRAELANRRRASAGDAGEIE